MSAITARTLVVAISACVALAGCTTGSGDSNTLTAKSAGGLPVARPVPKETAGLRMEV